MLGPRARKKRWAIKATGRVLTYKDLPKVCRSEWVPNLYQTSTRDRSKPDSSPPSEIPIDAILETGNTRDKAA
ncbi:hypothetical protein ACVWWD_005773 [Mesorhizobium sp. URHB0026]